MNNNLPDGDLTINSGVTITTTRNGYIKGISGTIKVTVTEANSNETVYTIIVIKEDEVS